MAATADDTFSRHMEAVARLLFGKPHPQLSSANELRFGTHGSMSIDLEQGVWSDHESKEGGGVLDLLKREKGLEVGPALDWLRSEVGADIEDRREQRKAADNVKPFARIVETYDYVDEHGEVLFQVCRMEPKDFRQRRPDPSAPGGWNWSVKGVRQIPYRLHEVIEAAAQGLIVFVVEGEKDADALAKAGLIATCNAGGAGKWPDGLAEHLAGADVVILPDNDAAGRNHASVVGAALRGVAARVRVLELPDLPPKGDVSDWLRAGNDGPHLYALAETAARDWAPAPPASRFGAIQWGDMDSVRVDYAPLVKGLIYQGDTGMFFGESGSGKSFLAVDMGLSIARGVPFLGMKTTPGSVLYQAGEGGRGLLKRLKAYRQEHRITDRSLPFVLLPEKLNLFSGDGDADAFIVECLAWKASLPQPLAAIFIDTFSAASAGANENASEDMGRMLDSGHRLNKATGAAVIWVHHKNAAGLRERGHSSFRANIETVVEVIRDPETKERTLHLAKLKDGEDGLRLGFELQSVTIGTDDDGDPITSCVVRPAQVGTAQTGKRPRLSPGQAKFIKVLDEACARHGGIVPRGPHTPDGQAGVEWGAFRDMYVMLCGQGRTPTAISTALSNDGDRLWREGLIERQDRWLWITEKGGRFVEY